MFFICSHCDRGHAYCGDRCRQKSRRQQRREANRRHQQSTEGRLDHRDRQRLHRQRRNCSTNPQESIFVTDHGSKAATNFGNISGPSSIERYEFLPSAVMIACRVCGRRGLLVNPFEPE
ncbi:MAG TPA: hypothetical protein VI837_11805 [Blastocatellia bacterium]|nr:hypothetical protein [Blastocatellia bacterium]